MTRYTIILAFLLFGCSKSVVKVGSEKYLVDSAQVSKITIHSNQLQPSSEGRVFLVDTKRYPLLGKQYTYKFTLKIDDKSPNKGQNVTIAKWDYNPDGLSNSKFSSGLSIWYHNGNLYGTVKYSRKRKDNNRPSRVQFFKFSNITQGKEYDITVNAKWDFKDSEIDVSIDGKTAGKYKGIIGCKSSFSPKFKYGVIDKSSGHQNYTIEFSDVDWY